MKRLAYIFMIILLVAATKATGQVFDTVCRGAERTYRIDGEPGSTWVWQLEAEDGTIVTPSRFEWSDFTDTRDGLPIQGSEVIILWDIEPGIYSLSAEQTSSHDCVNNELGEVEVVPAPDAFAGNEILACAGQSIFLEEATASNYSVLIWTSFGDGTFSDASAVRPTYFPGENDLAAGSVTLSLAAIGRGSAGSCEPAISTVDVILSQPEIVLTASSQSCYGGNAGSVLASLSGGTGVYTYAWTGPDGFTADTPEITNLASGRYYLSVTDELGCTAVDSADITQPDELLVEITPDPAQMCESDTLVLNGYSEGGTGIYTHLWTGGGIAFLSATDSATPEFRDAPAGSYQLVYKVTDENGCDNSDTIWVEVFPATRDTIELIACENELPYLWQGQSLSFPGFYSDTLQSVSGCDSILTVNLDVSPIYRDTTDYIACENELPYLWQGQSLSFPGFYSDTLQSVAGCDSILTVNLDVSPIYRDTTDYIACENELPYLWQGQSLSFPGFYSDTLQSVSGCDSILTVNLDVLPIYRDTTDYIACENELPYLWQGQSLSFPGFYSDTLQSVSGCDSILTVNLDVSPIYRDTTDYIACENELPYLWQGQSLSFPGFYSDTLQSVAGCDSILTVNLDVSPIYRDTTDYIACENELPYLWQGQSLSFPGFYSDTLQSVSGCDSILTVNLDVLPIYRDTTDYIACENELPYLWQGQSLSFPGFYSDTLQSVAGCDSILTVNLDVSPIYRDTTDYIACENELPYLWQGQSLSFPGFYSDTLQSVSGCDSILTVNLDVSPIYRDTTDYIACENELPYLWQGQSLSFPGFYSDTLQSVSGCDSILTVNLDVSPIYRDTIPMTVCAGDVPFDWYGQQISSAGFYEHTLTSVAGCDSILTLNFDVTPEYRDTIPMTVCAGDVPFDWYGQQISTAGFYEHTLTSVAGCDSILTLNFDVTPEYRDTIPMTVCAGDVPFDWYGQQISTAGFYEHTLTSVAGCDSILTLNFDVTPEYRDTIPMTVCAGDVPFDWYGQQINAAGFYEHTLTSVADCDSILTLNFDVTPEYRDTIPMIVCEGDVPFDWYGQQINAAGFYEHTLTSVAGCDSILTLNFDVTPEYRDTIPMTVCEGDVPFDWYGQSISAAGFYEHTLTSVAGCDSILTLNFDVTPEYRDTIPMTVCAGDVPFDWYGQQISVAGFYEHTLTSVAGCDSILTFNFDVTPEYRDTIPMIVCEGDVPFDWYGQQISSAGLYEHTLTSVAGCDSILTLNFDLTPEYRDTIPMIVCEGDVPFDWYGQQISSAGFYEHTLTSVAGCDSILTLNFDVTPEYRDTIPMTVCSGDVPFDWYGQQISAAGFYEHTLTSVAGCDSILTLNFDVTPEYRDTIPMTVCEGDVPFDWYGQQISTAGFYEHTLTSVAGCDSILTLNFDVTPEYRDTIPMIVCAGDVPFDWYGQQISAAGFYEHTLTSVAGCDSILTLNFDVTPEYRDTIPMTVCSGDVPFDWYGQQISAAGFYEHTLTSVAGCDSILTLNFDVTPEYRDTIPMTVCEGDVPFDWYGQSISAAGFYEHTLTSVAGCDSILTLNFDVTPEYRDTIPMTVCAGDVPFDWYGQQISSAGFYEHTLTSVAGCDSILTLNFDVTPEYRDTIPKIVCEGDVPFDWYGQQINAAGFYEHTLTSVAGCDSILTLNFDVTPEYRDTIPMTVCEGDVPFDWYGQSISAAGFYEHTLTSVAGCDSILTLNFDVTPEYRDTIPMTVCEGDVPFDWYGQSISAAGFYEHTLTSVAGCDSILTLNFDVTPEYRDTIPMTVCAGDVPFDWYGQQINAAGFYEHTLTSVAGCDSILTLNFDVTPEYRDTIPMTVCEGDVPFDWYGQQINAAGFYEHTLTSVAGCDSILTLNFDVTPEYRDTIPMTVCEGDVPFDWYGQQINAAGFYEHTLTSVAGCDSILTLNFDVTPEYRDTIPMTVCEGDVPFDWYGQQINAAGFYEHTLTSVAGCDSILTLNFDVTPEYRDTIPMTVCEGDVPFDWYGQQINAAGFYEHTLTSVAGCDSILTLNFDVTPEYRDTIPMIVCEGDVPFDWYGQQISAAGFYEHTLTSVAGCDSILTLNFDVTPEYRDTIPMTVCQGDVPFDWYGQQISAAGFYEHTLTSVAGCDSILTLNFDVTPEYRDTIPMIVCEGDVPFDWYGQQISAAGFYEHTLTSVSGCDSILTLNLDVTPEYRDTIPMIVCEGDVPFDWYGQQISAAGFYEHTLTSVSGCDSILTLNLDVTPEYRDTIPMIVCEGDVPFDWYGQQISAAGFYEHTLTSVSGCDSILTLNLDVTPEYRDTIPMIVCEGDVPFDWYGQQINAAGFYEHTLTSVAGCDSVLTLNFDVTPEYRDTIPMIVCEGDVPFDWYGQQISSAGFYEHTLTSVAGCDSILTLNFDVTPEYRDTIPMTVCEGDVPFDWYGQQINAAGFYEHILTSVAGCDSILTLNFDVTPEYRDTIPMTVCSGDVPFDWYGQQINAAGFYEHILTSVAGCDSILTLNFDVTPEYRDTIPMTVCSGDVPFDWYGQQINAAGFYEHTLTSVAGCDSILTLNFDVTPEYRDTIPMIVCSGDVPFDWYGQQISTAGFYEHTLTSVSGCDSILTLNFDVTPEYRDTIPMTVCSGDVPFDWYGQQISTAGFYEHTLTSVAGCDSILTLNFDLTPEYRDTIPMIVCEGDVPFDWYGQSISAAGFYEHTLTSVAGCDSILTLDLTTIPELTVSITIAADQTDVMEGEQVIFTATPVNGGTNPVYAWFVNDVPVTGETSITYTYIPVDGDVVYATLLSDLDCAAPKPAESNRITVTVTTKPDDLEATLTAVSILCFGESTGAIDLNVSGGTAPYSFTWSNGATTEDLTNLPAGTYTVTITDNTGLSVQLSVDVIQPTEIILSATKVDVGFSADPIGSIDLTVSGGTDPYSYEWTGPNGFTSTSQDIDNLEGGAYIVLVTDANGCEASYALVIEAKDPQYSMACPPDLAFDCVGDEDPIFRNYHEFVAAGGSAVSDCVLNEPSFSGVEISRTGTCPTTIIRRYSILDGCGNELECFQTIIIDDNVSPRFPLNPYPAVVDCVDDVPAPFRDGRQGYIQFRQRYGSATDNCGIDESTFRFIDGYPTDEDCPKIQTVRRVYEIKDFCGNYARFYERIEVKDEISPAIVCPPDVAFEGELSDLVTLTGLAYSETEQNIPLSNAGSLGLTISDNCAVVSLSYHDVATGNCPAIVRRTFTVSDGCNENSCTQVITLDHKIIPEFDPIGPLCQFSKAPSLHDTSKNGITGKWTPATINTATYGTGIYTFVPGAGQCAVEVTMEIEITDEIIPEFDPIGPFCLNETPADLPTVSENGITGTWDPAVISTSKIGVFSYTFNPEAGQCAAPFVIEIVVTDEIASVFDPIGPFCLNSVPPALPDVSVNGISGTWEPITINTSAYGEFDYTFTPFEGQCAGPVTIKIEITDEQVPDFVQMGPFCQNTVAPDLPTVSENGISGSWSPSTIGTAVAGMATYVFTPDPYLCATSVTMRIEIIKEVVPVFAQIGPLCQNSVPPELPDVSTNGVSGNWSPSSIDTDVPGVFMFVFTPQGETCYKEDTMYIEIQQEIVPQVAPIGPLCLGEAPPTLPLTDVNGIAGTWKPSAVSTAATGEFEFVFIPDAGYACAINDTIIIEIQDNISPVFDVIGPVCQLDVPPALPNADLNDVTGTWSPDTIDTSTPGLYDFTFTPDAIFPCAVPVTITVEINTLIIPQFAPIGPLCQNSDAPDLPEANFNGVTGVWIPAVISTDQPGIFPYAFTPDDGFNCARPDTLYVEIMPSIIPEFAPIGPLCIGENPVTLPSTDKNGVAGTWEPAIVDISTPGVFEFVFIPDGAVDCAFNDTIQIEVIDNAPPLALNDSTVTLQNQTVMIAVLDNDSDANSELDVTSVRIIKNPENGTATASPLTGVVTYTPSVDFVGYDTLFYAVSDDGIPCDPLSDTARVVFEVKVPNNPPVAVNDSFSVMCFPLIEYVLPNDYDPDGDNFRIITWPMVDVQHGTVSIASDGAFVYMPDEEFVGIDTFVYRICDDGFPSMCDEATVWINVLPSVDCDGLPDDEEEIPTECSLFIPEGFSPNGDNVHDFFQIYCIEKYPDAIMRIFDRAGNKLFEKRNYGNLDKWGSDQNAWWWGNSEHTFTLGRGTVPAGNYLYVLELGNGEVRTGTVMVAY
ncbi:gliding motility-associated C-terminal domain-containing protein [Mariniphaga anaerophila]|uniref:Gliding motility-associated C-terminal domain-containing protein n=1 Tax=Mariniphaga anaerophila TaxID=1484053 RepID=A0A1M4YXL5_9BACT|nr:Ig-like domain-containing protein [Mariniphaga anaerophila]SHF10455.1 gliding motility-associated C-terminal domain-containing protein [Mariniphaga anaerophila]